MEPLPGETFVGAIAVRMSKIIIRLLGDAEILFWNG
jgi:hypothetical protein